MIMKVLRFFYRVITDNTGSIKEQNDYYPFGMRHSNANLMLSANRWQFNGKEKQTTGNLNYMDYGARMYDDFTSRWFVIDPLAEKYYPVSSYTFSANNPLRFVDPNGENILDAIKSGAKWIGNTIATGATLAWNGAKEIARGTLNSGLTVAAIPQVLAGNIATMFTEDNEYPDWAVPIQVNSNYDVEQKHGWVKENLSWEDGKEVIKNTIGAILFFMPFSNSTTAGERFIENTVISTGVSIGTNEVLPTSNQSTENHSEEKIENTDNSKSIEMPQKQQIITDDFIKKLVCP